MIYIVKLLAVKDCFHHFIFISQTYTAKHHIS